MCNFVQQYLFEALAHVPFDMAREHAQEDIGAHSWRQPVVDRAEVQVDGLQAAKGALDKGETFVGTDDPIRRQGIALDAGADDIKTVEPGFGGDANGVAGKGRAVFSDGDVEQLGEVVAVSMRPTARAMLSCPLGQCAARSGRPAWSMLLRWPVVDPRACAPAPRPIAGSCRRPDARQETREQ
jgi:hypothetical protein